MTSWDKPRLDVFFLTATNYAGTDAQITHGWSENTRDWGWEGLGLPRV